MDAEDAEEPDPLPADAATVVWLSRKDLNMSISHDDEERAEMAAALGVEELPNPAEQPDRPSVTVTTGDTMSPALARRALPGHEDLIAVYNHEGERLDYPSRSERKNMLAFSPGDHGDVNPKWATDESAALQRAEEEAVEQAREAAGEESD